MLPQRPKSPGGGFVAPNAARSAAWHDDVVVLGGADGVVVAPLVGVDEEAPVDGGAGEVKAAVDELCLGRDGEGRVAPGRRERLEWARGATRAEEAGREAPAFRVWAAATGEGRLGEDFWAGGREGGQRKV